MQMQFLSREASKHLESAIVSKLDEIRGTIYVCTDTELLEVKVPLICLGTEGVSPRRDGR